MWASQPVSANESGKIAGNPSGICNSATSSDDLIVTPTVPLGVFKVKCAQVRPFISSSSDVTVKRRGFFFLKMRSLLSRPLYLL